MKSCYDLIGHTQASLAIRRMGVPESAVDCIFTTLQEATHRVRTGYGDSTASYGGNKEDTPIHGICQGNGAGPAIWAVLSSLLLDIQREKGFGFYFFTPLSKQKVQFVRYVFINNSNLVERLKNGGVWQAVLQSIQASVTNLEDSLSPLEVQKRKRM